MRRLGPIVAIAVALVACSADEPPTVGDSTNAAGTAPATTPAEPLPELAIAHCAPGPLLPADNLEVCGTELLAQLFTPLVTYDPETAEPVLALAETIETDDQTTWTITLHNGWTFHNGEPVTARSFVAAWNLAARPEYTNSRYLDMIAGYDAVADGSADALAGLRITGEQSFEVRLERPFSQLPLLLGFNPFFPLPRDAIANPAAFDVNPIGTGPYRLASRTGDEIVLEPYPRYAGEPARFGQVTYHLFPDDAYGFSEFDGGGIDVAELPPDLLDDYAEELGDRLQTDDGALFEYLALPVTVAPFDDRRVRQALSLAIDRVRLASEIRSGAARPAGALIAPVLRPRDTLCELCRHDAERARMLLDEAGGFDAPIVLRGNDPALLAAVAAGWRLDLGVQVNVEAGGSPEELRTGSTALHLGGWVFDYPSPQNYLEPLYAAGAPANYGGYASSDVEAFLAQGNAAASQEEALAAYERAESLLLTDLPVLPLLFSRSLFVRSERVTDLVVDRSGLVSLAATQVSD